MKWTSSIVLCVLLFTGTLCWGQDLERKGPGKRWWASVAAMVGASALDCQSSWGRQELNPVLAGADGRFGAKALGIKAGVAASVAVAQYFLLRKSPGAEKYFTYGNLGMAGVFSAAAYRNHTNQHSVNLGPAPAPVSPDYLAAAPTSVH